MFHLDFCEYLVWKNYDRLCSSYNPDLLRIIT